MMLRHTPPCSPAGLQAALVLLFSGLALHGANALAQTPVGTIEAVQGHDSVRVVLTSDATVRTGILVYVVDFDNDTRTWLPKAELALGRAAGRFTRARVISIKNGAELQLGDRVVVYDAQAAHGSLKVEPGDAQLLRGDALPLARSGSTPRAACFSR